MTRQPDYQKAILDRIAEEFGIDKQKVYNMYYYQFKWVADNMRKSSPDILINNFCSWRLKKKVKKKIKEASQNE